MAPRFSQRLEARRSPMKVDPAADDGTIKAAFRRLALRYHPDRAGTPRAARAFGRSARPMSSAGARRHGRLRDRPDLLGLELGLAVDADIGRGVARRPKPPPRKGPPRRRPSGR